MSEDQDSIDALQGALGSDFEIKRLMGRGAMANVYLAKETQLGRFVALKVLLSQHSKDETARKRFEREAKAAASLSHPSVVQVYRFGRLPDETPFLVMRFVKGRTMEERLKAEGRLATALTRQVLLEVASALSAAHSQGIVHRDVRPANVLWDEESERALLSDFGIAALLVTSGEEATRLTKTGQIMGDPRYLSPEQLLDQDLTELADIYAFGVMGYELLTGEGPYDARTNTQWITAHLSQDPKDLRIARPDVPADIADLLKRCLSREPKHRPSAADVVSVLAGDPSGAAAGGPTSGGVEEAADFQQLIRRRVPQVVIITGGAGLGLMSLMNELTADQQLLDPIWYRLTLPFVACGLAAATVIAWFHGERGKQQTNVLEWVLLSVIGVIWFSISAWMIVGQL
ncbi:MAG: serine/threonine-protein kinase [Gemmatimonadetes bacterium]|nr:serine/threonine-protein kinase [Gemmatimonadota bacterium]